MSLLKTYTNEEKRKLKLCRLSNDKHSISSDAFVLGCRSMADEIAELREFKRRALECLDYTLNWAPSSWKAKSVEDLLSEHEKALERYKAFKESQNK